MGRTGEEGQSTPAASGWSAVGTAAAYAAAIVAFGYALMSLYWALGGHGLVSTYTPPYTTSSRLAPAELISSHRRGTTRPHGRTSASASRPPTTFAGAAARATSTGTAPPRRANCCTYPPIVSGGPGRRAGPDRAAAGAGHGGACRGRGWLGVRLTAGVGSAVVLERHPGWRAPSAARARPRLHRCMRPGWPHRVHTAADRMWRFDSERSRPGRFLPARSLQP
jgi:hypothetical protein